MQKIIITVNSNRPFQDDMLEVLKNKHPDIKVKFKIQKFALDIYQTTTIVISGAVLLIEILKLIFPIQKHHPDSKTEIELKLESTGKTLKISAGKDDINIEKIANDFLSEGEKQTKKDSKAN